MKLKDIINEAATSAPAKGNMVKVIDPSKLRGGAKDLATHIKVNGQKHNSFLVHKVTPQYIIVSHIGSSEGSMDEDEKFRIGHDNVKVIRKSPKYSKAQRGGSHRMSGGGMGR